MGCRRAYASSRGERSSTTAAAVAKVPKGSSAAEMAAKAGSVLRGAALRHQANSKSGAKTPSHSYHAHEDTKKKARDNRQARAAPVTGLKSSAKGRSAAIPQAGSRK